MFVFVLYRINLGMCNRHGHMWNVNLENLIPVWHLGSDVKKWTNWKFVCLSLKVCVFVWVNMCVRFLPMCDSCALKWINIFKSKHKKGIKQASIISSLWKEIPSRSNQKKFHTRGLSSPCQIGLVDFAFMRLYVFVFARSLRPWISSCLVFIV